MRRDFRALRRETIGELAAEEEAAAKEAAAKEAAEKEAAEKEAAVAEAGESGGAKRKADACDFNEACME